jgi:hypothetical protein
MKLAFVADDLLTPEETHDLDLLLYHPPSCVEIHAQRFVLHRVPAHTYAEAQFAASEYIHLGCLLGNEGRLPLGENDDSRDQFQVRQGRQVAEEYKRLVEHLPVSIPLPAWTVGGICAQDVVKGDKVTIAQSFYRLGIVANNYGVRTNFGLRKRDSYLHFQIPHDLAAMFSLLFVTVMFDLPASLFSKKPGYGLPADPDN